MPQYRYWSFLLDHVAPPPSHMSTFEIRRCEAGKGRPEEKREEKGTREAQMWGGLKGS